MSTDHDSRLSMLLAEGPKVLAILEAGAAPPDAATIAAMSELPGPELPRLLELLALCGLAERQPDGSGYRPGRRLHPASRSVDDDFALLRQAAHDIVALQRATGCTAALALAGDAEAVLVEVAGDPGDAAVGQRLPLETSAIGRAILAALPPARRKALLAAVDGADRRRALAADLDLIAARGYALVTGAAAPGPAGVAAAIVDGQGQAVAAIGIDCPGAPVSREQLHALGPAVVEATRAASRLAGGAPRPHSRAARPAAAVTPGVRRLSPNCSLIGESPLDDPATGRLWWVDMYDPAIHRLDRRSGATESFHPGEMVTALSLAPGGLLAAAQSGLWLLDATTCERLRFLGDPEADRPGSRFNDGKSDRSGRFWVNTVDLGFAPGAGALYRMDADGGFARMDAGLDLPNGLGWAPDGTVMYLADTGRRTIYAYDFTEGTGEIANRRVFARLAEDATGAPDGLDVDPEGNVWVAIFDGWRLEKYAPDGTLLELVVLPVPRPTSCRLAGAGGRTLVVTSARIRLPEPLLREAPGSGAVFEVEL